MKYRREECSHLAEEPVRLRFVSLRASARRRLSAALWSAAAAPSAAAERASCSAASASRQSLAGRARDHHRERSMEHPPTYAAPEGAPRLIALRSADVLRGSIIAAAGTSPVAGLVADGEAVRPSPPASELPSDIRNCSSDGLACFRWPPLKITASSGFTW